MNSPLAAYLYIRTAEMPPEDVTDEWFLAPEPSPITDERMNAFTQQVDGLMSDLEGLEDPADEEAIQFFFYERAKAAFGDEKGSIREFFKLLYLVVFERPEGPRWGQFVALTGRDEFLDRLRSRLANPLSVREDSPDAEDSPAPA